MTQTLKLPSCVLVHSVQSDVLNRQTGKCVMQICHGSELPSKNPWRGSKCPGRFLEMVASAREKPHFLDLQEESGMGHNLVQRRQEVTGQRESESPPRSPSRAALCPSFLAAIGSLFLSGWELRGSSGFPHLPPQVSPVHSIVGSRTEFSMSPTCLLSSWRNLLAKHLLALWVLGGGRAEALRIASSTFPRLWGCSLTSFIQLGPRQLLAGSLSAHRGTLGCAAPASSSNTLGQF